MSKDVLALQRIKEASEKAKHELSNTFETGINIPFITSGSSGPEHLLVKFARTKLEELTNDLIKKSIDITRKVVEDSGLKLGEINEIILVGGQTRMPAMQKAVKDLLAKSRINPSIPQKLSLWERRCKGRHYERGGERCFAFWMSSHCRLA